MSDPADTENQDLQNTITGRTAAPPGLDHNCFAGGGVGARWTTPGMRPPPLAAALSDLVD